MGNTATNNGHGNETMNDETLRLLVTSKTIAEVIDTLTSRVQDCTAMVQTILETEIDALAVRQLDRFEAMGEVYRDQIGIVANTYPGA